jgi:hypothetical protein
VERLTAGRFDDAERVGEVLLCTPAWRVVVAAVGYRAEDVLLILGEQFLGFDT